MVFTRNLSAYGEHAYTAKLQPRKIITNIKIIIITQNDTILCISPYFLPVAAAARFEPSNLGT